LADRFIVGMAPVDCGPELLLMPSGFHLTVDTLPSPAAAAEASEALPSPSDMAPSIRAPVGLQPT